MSPGPQWLTATAAPQRAVLGRVVALAFESDHRAANGAKLLRRAVAQAITVDARPVRSVMSEQGAQEMPKPDWTTEVAPTRNDPTTHTMGDHVRVSVSIAFAQLTGGAARLQRVYSVASGVVALTFNTAFSGRTVHSGERLELSNLVSSGPLWRIVGRFEQTIAWYAELEGYVGPVFLGRTGPHRLYTLLQPPSGQAEFEVSAAGRQHFAERGQVQAITDARLEVVCRGAQGANTEADTVERLFRDFKVRGIGYRLGRQWVPPNLRPRHPRTHHLLNPTAVEPYPTLEHFLWLCIAHQAEAECHVIAAAFRLACRATGVGGAMDVGYMMPLPGRLEQPPSYPRRSDRLKGRLNQQTVRRGGGVLAFFDAHGQANEFEGVVTYNRALYAIGDAIFDRFSSDVAGTSAEDLNASDYFTLRLSSPGSEVRSAMLDESAGNFDLAFVDGRGHILPEQYPWSTMPDGHPHMLRDQPFRWED